MEEIKNQIIAEKILTTKIDNGLTVYMMPRHNYHKQYAILATDFGSIDNNFINPVTGQKEIIPDGIAHFLEHKLFEGETENAFTQFARLGSSANAFTNFTTTAYLFSSFANFTESLQSLLDFVQEPHFTDENVEKEKGIIAQEIRMYDDEPNYQVYYNLLQGMYHQHPVKIDIAGTETSIRQISKEDLYLCYNTFYHPGNMFLFIIGNIDPTATLEAIKENQSKKEYGEWGKVARIKTEEPRGVFQKKIVKKMNVSQPLYRLGFKESEMPTNPEQLIKQEIATDLLIELLSGKGSELYQALYDQGLIDDRFHSYYTLEKGFGYILLGGETREPELLNEKLMGGLVHGLDYITQDNFLRIYKQYIGNYVESYNSFQHTAAEFVNNYFKGVNYFNLLDIIQQIDLDYLLERYAVLFKEENAAVSIVLSKQRKKG